MLRKKSKKPQSYLQEETLTQEEKLDRNIKKKKRMIKQIKHDIIIKITVFVAAFVIIFTFIFGVTKAPTNDMFPAVHEGDVVVYYRLGSIINTDVVVYETDDGKNIGRIQAMPGSTIDRSASDQITIDGNLQPIQKRAGLYYKTYLKEGGSLQVPSAVPEEAYLILGDNRETSTDSRDYGYIPKKQIKGKVFTIIRRRPL